MSRAGIETVQLIHTIDGRPDVDRAFYTREDIEEEIAQASDNGGYSPTWIEFQCLAAQFYDAVLRLRSSMALVVLTFPPEGTVGEGVEPKT